MSPISTKCQFLGLNERLLHLKTAFKSSDSKPSVDLCFAHVSTICMTHAFQPDMHAAWQPMYVDDGVIVEPQRVKSTSVVLVPILRLLGINSLPFLVKGMLSQAARGQP